jgi:hypothetical protein
MAIEEIWEEGNEIYIRDDEGIVSLVDAGWWRGCQDCGAYEGEIADVAKEQGDLAACKFALEHLTGRVFLCEKCRE